MLEGNRNGWYILWPFGIHYGHFVHFMAIWLFSGNLVYVPPFWYIMSRKIWQPCFIAQNKLENEGGFHSMTKLAGGTIYVLHTYVHIVRKPIS
jgi:hypothetical protein